MKRALELLSPARDLACGIAAIDHGADAVYIGAPQFGARAAAGNSVDDIARLCQYAHQYLAKVYVTVNTIVYDDELSSVRTLLHQLSSAGVDAVLFQDMAIPAMVREERLPIQLHASTQTDNHTAEKVEWLKGLGASRVVLARELSQQEIADIHRRVPDVELEVFVHGALCVSLSGLCYASHYCFRRSANRGECAQLCRMKYDLIDSDGQILQHDRYLLSLKDLNQSNHLAELIEAGATSFKIEGRLKDAAYVKNVTAAYSQQLDQFISQHPDKYERASLGRCHYTFTPDLSKTFNRGYTTYFLNGRQPDIFSPDTPKAMGEFVGIVTELKGGKCVVVDSHTPFSNGDGLCFIDDTHQLQGFRVNRVDGNRLTLAGKLPPMLRRGMSLYRNNDQQMERLLAGKSAERKIPIALTLSATADGFRLAATDGRHRATAEIACEHQIAQKPQREYITRELSKLGNTPYVCEEVSFATSDYFIPASRLAELRRKCIEGMETPYSPPHPLDSPGVKLEGWRQQQPFMLNISNRLARKFYERLSAPSEPLAPAFELHEPDGEKVIMQCRHCLRYALGHCVKNGGSPPSWREPLFLSLANGRRFKLRFDCSNCQMDVITATAAGSPR